MPCSWRQRTGFPAARQCRSQTGSGFYRRAEEAERSQPRRDAKEREYVIHPISRLASNLLDKPLLNLGNKIEARRRAEDLLKQKVSEEDIAAAHATIARTAAMLHVRKARRK